MAYKVCGVSRIGDYTLKETVWVKDLAEAMSMIGSWNAHDYVTLARKKLVVSPPYRSYRR